jgi:hypothetical protein
MPAAPARRKAIHRAILKDPAQQGTGKARSSLPWA